jgi:hypothetical protein
MVVCCRVPSSSLVTTTHYFVFLVMFVVNLSHCSSLSSSFPSQEFSLSSSPVRDEDSSKVTVSKSIHSHVSNSLVMRELISFLEREEKSSFVCDCKDSCQSKLSLNETTKSKQLKWRILQDNETSVSGT